MLSKYSVLALIGAANAATAAPLRGTTAAWPKWTATAPTGTDLDTGSVKTTWTGTVAKGNYKGYRTDILTFPLQKVDIASAATDAGRAKVSALATGETTFYMTDSTKYATQTVKATETTADFGTTAANAKSWNVCATAATAVVCNGGVSLFAAGAGPTLTYRAIADRLWQQVSKTAATTESVGGNTTGFFNLAQLAWNQDIVLGSMYHSAGTVTTTGTIWCSAWKNTLVKAGTEVVFSSTMGFDAAGKCTWQFAADDKGYGPGFTATAMKFAAFEFQYVEWINVAALGTNGVIGAADDTKYFAGAYATTGGVFVNPAVTMPSGVSLLGVTLAFYDSYQNAPNDWIPGSVGKAIYYPNSTGQWSDAQTIAHDSSVLLDRFSFVSDIYNNYNTQLNTYNGLKTTYNDAATKESERLKDFFKATFDPPVLVPTRPCAPSQPAEYSGVYMDLSKSITDGWETTQAKQMKLASLQTSAGAGGHVDTFHTRLGYLYTTLDTAATTIDVANIGHLFGRFGEGSLNVPANAMPFYFGKEDAANISGMNVSGFPNTQASTGLAAAADTNTFSAKALAWASYDSFKVMARPGAATDPTNVLIGAKALMATGLAAAAVVATIA